MFVVQFGLLGALAVVVCRIEFVQSAFGPSLLANAAKVENTSHVVLAQRGAILDTNGQTLAYDVPAYMLDIKTDGFQSLPTLANQIAPILGSTPAQVLTVLKSGGGHWARWQTPILANAKDQVLKAIGKGHGQDVTFTPTEQRFYPFGIFAANTIGFVNQSGTAVNGLEAEYNRVLQGENGTLAYTQDRWGFPIQSSVQVVKPSLPGDNLETTIDGTIQGFVEQTMDELVKKYNPEHAAIIVTDPKTGGILAMSSRPTFNPNQYWNASSATALNTNWAVDASFEPGSTFKPLTLAAALATHSIDINRVFMSGHTTIAGQTIYDWNIKGWGPITYQEALEKSSNVGFAKIALAVGWPNLLHYMQVFGYLAPTGVDLPGEATSQIFSPASRNEIELATSGFGQGISVTPLQQMAAIGAIANGGKLIQPHLAKALVNAETGTVVKSFEPVVENPQVVPKDVIALLNKTLVLDVSGAQGIDGIAQIPGYQVAGKTGTANTVDPLTHKYYANRFIVSFIGYAPASNPKYEIYVTLDWPKTSIGNQWGSTIAGPAAKKILEESLQYSHIPPDDPSTLPAPTKVNNAAIPSTAQMTRVPSIVGMSPASAKAKLAKVGLAFQGVSSGSAITKQWPEATAAVAKGTNVYGLVAGGKAGATTMPDVRGASLREAVEILDSIGVKTQVSGVGYVSAQSIAPGKPIAGATVQLTCSPPQTAVGAAGSG